MVDNCSDFESHYNFSVYLFSGLTLACLCVLGLAGNVISITILTQLYLRQTIFRLYLNALCISDCLTLIGSLLSTSLPILLGHSLHLSNQVAALYFIAYPMRHFGQSASTWMTVLISCIRFVGVKYPFLDRKLSKMKRALALISIVYIFAVVVNVTKFYELHKLSCFNGNKTETIVVHSGLRYNQQYRTLYLGWLNAISMFIVPFILITALNYLMSKTISSGYFRGRCFQGQDERQKQILISRLLITIAIIFLVCRLIPLGQAVLEIFANKFLSDISDISSRALNHRTKKLTIDQISTFMITVNASCNFIIYLLFSQKFRSQLRATLSHIREALKEVMEIGMMPLLYQKMQNNLSHRSSIHSLSPTPATRPASPVSAPISPCGSPCPLMYSKSCVHYTRRHRCVEQLTVYQCNTKIASFGKQNSVANYTFLNDATSIQL